MTDISNLFRQAQEMQNKIAAVQEELARRTVSASSGGGMVTVVCSGKQQVQSIHIDKTIVDPDDLTMLEDLVLTAVNEGLRLSQEMAAREMASVTGGFNIPGLS